MTSFVHFGSAHVSVIALTVVLPVVLSVIARRDDSGDSVEIIRWLFIIFLVGSKVADLGILFRDGEFGLETVLPMHLCDWALVVAIVTLVCPNQATFELCYFWALGGTAQAVLTPDVSSQFPDPRFITFFALHGGVVAALLFMTIGMAMRPVPMSILRVLAWSTVYLCLALATNYAFATNFGYLRAKPAQPSLLDYMAPWPFYIFELIGLTLVFTLLLYAPYFIIDVIRRAQAG